MFPFCRCLQPEEDEPFQRPKTRNSITDPVHKTRRPVFLKPSVTNLDDDSYTKTLEQLQQECLEAHNTCRAKHSVQPLVLCPQLNNYAMEWAKHLAKINALQHRKKNKYGENLYLGTGMGNQAHQLAVQAWYDEIKNYNFNKPGFSSQTGHFTQVVWKQTKKLGVGVISKDNRTWVVCNYDPPGNVMGLYMDCVPLLVEMTVFKIIQKMKPQKNFRLRQMAAAAAEVEKAKQIEERMTQMLPDENVFTQFQLECLESHNKLRAIHGCPPLKLNMRLCNHAQDWSRTMSKRNSVFHSPQSEFGENIFYYMNFEPTAEQCVRTWYDEIKHYNFSKPGYDSRTGHFSQLIWRDSQKLGVGISKIDKMTYIVCNYFPPGNVTNQFKEQVPPPLAKPYVVVPTKPRSSEVKPYQPTTFEEECLEGHNTFRSIHGTPTMILNKNLSFFAKDWAQVRTTNMSYTIKTTTTTTTSTETNK